MNEYADCWTYPSTVIDEKFQEKSAMSDYYTKSQTDDAFQKKTSMSNYYTKSQADNKFALKTINDTVSYTYADNAIKQVISGNVVHITVAATIDLPDTGFALVGTITHALPTADHYVVMAVNSNYTETGLLGVLTSGQVRIYNKNSPKTNQSVYGEIMYII